MFGLFSRKKEVEQIKQDTKEGFESVKKDITAVGGWIKHLDSEKEIQKRDISEIKEVLSSVQEEIEEMKNLFSLMNQTRIPGKNKQMFKTAYRCLTNKQMFMLCKQVFKQLFKHQI